MATISEALAIAIQHHQAGRLPAAEQIYRQILQADPNQADAIHLLGVIAHQVGRHEAAIELIERAISLKGNVAERHHNLASAYRALGRITDAAASSRRALEYDPHFPEAHLSLGLALKDQGQVAEAIAHYRRAVELKPGLAEAHNALGMAFAQEGMLEESIVCFTRAVELKADYAEAYSNLGVAYKEQRKVAEAITCYRRALALQPAYVEAHNNLGNALRDQGYFDEAIACFHRALQLNPNFPQAHLNLGLSYRDQGNLEEALKCSARAVAMNPSFAEAIGSQGLVFSDMGRPNDALGCFRRALELKPKYSEARRNLGMLLLLFGRYEEGWREYEHRLECSSEPRDFSQPRWTGEPANGRTLLIYNEQGLGDTLHFLRYAQLVRSRAGAARVILETQPALSRLLTQNSGDEFEIVAGQSCGESALPPFDWQVALLSLPLALGILEPLPLPRQHIRADPDLRCAWRKRLGSGSAMRVGLVWAGSPEHKADRFRSIPPEQLLPLLQLPEFQFYSLQIGARSQSSALTEAGLIDLTSHIADFADTAAFVAGLDLVISVDTAVAHLAGAIHRPVWTLLPFKSEWRWGLAGETTPWYPTMRLFRQPTFGDWDAVVQRVAAELNLLARMSPRMTNDE